MNTDKQLPEQYRLIAADLSLKRPGFCEMLIDKTNGECKIKSVSLYSVDNKSKTKPVGQILHEIADVFHNIVLKNRDMPTFYVREKSVNNYGFAARGGAIARAAISEVVGIIDYEAWKERKEFDEIYPVTIKKTIAGSGKADKTQVANALKKYVGDLSYKNDDESDATAVAVAFLIISGELKQKETEENE